MSTTAVGQCPQCAAVINRHWTACLVCHAPISFKAETPAKSLAAPLPAIAAGSLVSWTRGDGSIQSGFVDLIHVDDIGARWSFVSLPGGTWAVVNVRFLKEVTL